MTTDNPDQLEALAEELCAERCAQAGDPPCSRVSSDPHCDECQGMAKRVAQHYAPVIAREARLRELAGFASQAFDTYVQQVNDRDPSEAEAAYSSAFAALRNELDKALGAKP